jgi:hypothetical protein
MIRDSTTATGRKPRLVVSDLGTEFENDKVATYCRENGIHLQPTPARAKELNGVAEKSVDTVKNHMRAMLLACGMPEHRPGAWWRAVAHHVFLWNRTHIGSNTGMTPYEAINKRVPSIINVGEFGCDAFVHQDRTQRDTTCSPKAKPGIYLGHDSRQNCPVIFMLDTGKKVFVKDVHFREGSFKHLQADIANQWGQVPSLDFVSIIDEPDEPIAIDDSESESEEDEEESRWEVEAITGHRGHGTRHEYRVQWVDHAKPTWEKAATLHDDAPDLVRKYEESIIRQTRSSRNQVTTQSSSSSSSSSSAPTSSK